MDVLRISRVYRKNVFLVKCEHAHVGVKIFTAETSQEIEIKHRSLSKCFSKLYYVLPIAIQQEYLLRNKNSPNSKSV